ncbi:MAG: ABC-F family ATP-binding cassette domain-containing protein [Alphaproteobacteria bacterium]
MLSIQELNYRIGGRVLFNNVSVNIPAGHRIGLVGPNGAGKSTLFKIIAGEIGADSGHISLIKNATMGMVRQDIPEDDTPLLDIVLAADTERSALLAEAETATDPDRIGEIYERLNDIDAYEAPARAASILAGLGFDEAAQMLPITAYSGGWRARVALAAVLFKQPNVLLLDEPTNHLDFESMIWLENFLARYRETLIIISHDRDILNKTVDHILHLENQHLVSYTGNYDQFERQRAEKLMNQQALHEKQMAQKAHAMKFVDRFRATASKARQAQSRLKAIERMDIVDAVIAERVTAFTFPEPKELRSPLIRLEKVDAGYSPAKPVLRGLDLQIDQQDRIALLGANGNGKSTLVKLLAGRLDPLGGTVYKSGKLKVGYFAQFQTDELDGAETPFSIMRPVMAESPEAKVRACLSQFGFDKRKADTLVADLSGGEKARLLFCLMSYDAPHIMLLDEPTNHLDMDAREALIQALNNYSGAVILVSHDPHLVECVADQLWLVADGKCRAFDDDLDAYRKFVIRQRKLERDKPKSAQPAASSPKNGGDSPERQAQELERQIADLRQQREQIETAIAAACAPGQDPKHLAQLNQDFAHLRQKLAQAEADLAALIDRL